MQINLKIKSWRGKMTFVMTWRLALLISYEWEIFMNLQNRIIFALFSNTRYGCLILSAHSHAVFSVIHRIKEGSLFPGDFRHSSEYFDLSIHRKPYAYRYFTLTLKVIRSYHIFMNKVSSRKSLCTEKSRKKKLGHKIHSHSHLSLFQPECL